MDGIENKIDPGPASDTDGLGGANTSVPLPDNLFDALRALESSDVMEGKLGSPCVNAFIKLRRGQWSEYSQHLTEWERAK